MKGMSVLAAVAMVLMVHAWGISATGASRMVSCEADCTGVSNGDKVANPRNCTEFYYCNNGEAFGPVPCDSGHFDPAEGDCVAGDTCDPICGSAGGNCPLTCNDTLDGVGNAFDCSIYYFCTSLGPVGPYTCPVERPYYDANSYACVNDESVCCVGYCYPYCSGSGLALVPDPKNHSKYYICGNEEGIPGEEYHFVCDADGYFNVQAGECVDGPMPDLFPTLCDATTVGPNCALTCNGTHGSVGDAFNCSTFYICTNPTPRQCSSVDRPYFDTNSQVCQSDDSVCCKGYCLPYCSGSGYEVVPDPRDCSKYYVCGNEEGIPSEEYHFTCPGGGYFHVQRGECIGSSVPDPCPTLCEAA